MSAPAFKRAPSWYVIKTAKRVGHVVDAYLAHDGNLTCYLSGAARFATFAQAARRLYGFQQNGVEDDMVKWGARVVGLLTKSGQP